MRNAMRHASIAALFHVSGGLFAASTGPIDCSDLTGMLSGLAEHYDNSQLVDSGPEVLREAKEGSLSSIALLGRYFRNGERGFPKNEAIGFCLIYRGFEAGYTGAALDVAEKYARSGQFYEAARHYGIAFGYWYVAENLQMKGGLEDPLDPEPHLTHHVFAEFRLLVESQELDRERAAQEFLYGIRAGASRSGDLQRLYGQRP